MPASDTISGVEDVTRDPPRDIESDVEQPEAAYRGFLFADLRGYTAFVERHGDAAGADLLDAYRSLVRQEVARHAGAEIRTEGDSFYVVFPSARRAVSCGLAIVAAAERARLEHPEQPIRVGIGVNAGETVQRGEGFVGSAVNVAARVCAQAREGEVLITAAVRDAVGAGAGLRMVARGSRRLKGIARPVLLFAVEQESAAAHRRPLVVAGVPRLALAVLVSAGVLAVAAVALIGGLDGSRVTPETAGSPGAGAPSPSEPALTSATAGPSVDPDAYPNALETSLLALLGPAAVDDCERADDDLRPRFHVDPITAAAFNVGTREPMEIAAGITCEIASVTAPDLLHLWTPRGTFDFSPIEVPEALILNRAGALGIPRGDCSSQPVAHGRWAIGDVGGWLLCRELYGDAILEWTYEGRAFVGIAVNRDGDLNALLRWWTAEARLLRP